MASIDTSDIALGDFEKYVQEKRKTPGIYSTEFQSLPLADTDKCVAAKEEQNLVKNRYMTRLPYDHSRVVLDVQDSNQGEYINANYINGYTRLKEYIATQGPLPDTAADFWRLVWQEGANVIHMMCNVIESCQERCYPYWPQAVGASRMYGDIEVTTEKQTTQEFCVIRLLSIQKQGERREVHHLHFTSWVDLGTPVHGVTSLLEFIKVSHTFDQVCKGPKIVNCSAGVGRTGTFIALDILTQQAKKEGKVSICACVQQLRLQRMHSVETLGQYVFLHDALLVFIQQLHDNASTP